MANSFFCFMILILSINCQSMRPMSFSIRFCLIFNHLSMEKFKASLDILSKRKYFKIIIFGNNHIVSSGIRASAARDAKQSKWKNEINERPENINQTISYCQHSKHECRWKAGLEFWMLFSCNKHIICQRPFATIRNVFFEGTLGDFQKLFYSAKGVHTPLPLPP